MNQCDGCFYRIAWEKDHAATQVDIPGEGSGSRFLSPDIHPESYTGHDKVPQELLQPSALMIAQIKASMPLVEISSEEAQKRWIDQSLGVLSEF